MLRVLHYLYCESSGIGSMRVIRSSCWHCAVLCLFPAVAVIQSLPIFDETRLYGLPLPVQLGDSLSFSYTLQFYLVLMFLGETSTNTPSSRPTKPGTPQNTPEETLNDVCDCRVMGWLICFSVLCHQRSMCWTLSPPYWHKFSLLRRTLSQFATTEQAEEATLPSQERQNGISDKAAVFFNSYCLLPSLHKQMHKQKPQMHYTKHKLLFKLSDSLF